MKTWIQINLIINNKLVSKRCKKEWFEKYGYSKEYQKILDITSFLDDINPILPQRIWHIVNDNLEKNKCCNPVCNNITTFFAFTNGYLRTCCCSCAQFDPNTINKIKSTNLQRYGTEYGLSNRKIIEKRNVTIKNRYGVSNISQLKEISEKKKQTCLKHFGTEWFLERQDIKENIINEKYGVNNIQKIKDISEKTSKTKRDDFYNNLLQSDRFKDKVKILCTKDEYLGVGKKYNFECLYCKNIFSYQLRWDRIPRCLTCYPSSGSSLFEKEITEYVKFLLPNEIIIENTKSILLNNKELDIYIPSKNIAIECDGLFWHGEINGNKDKNYHLSKLIDCNNKNIKLIHIFEDEWLKKQEIVKSKLRHLLGVNQMKKIYARKCKIKILIPDEKKYFLNENHIQGNDISTINLGLFYNEELVAVMTFCKKRIFMNQKSEKDEYELSRYASLNTCNVLGGAGKLLNYFIENYNPSKITSYADRRWTSKENNIYEKIGFKKISDGIPNYWYFNRGINYKRFHRYGFAKHTLSKKLLMFNSSLSEWENMKNNGWDRIWDCGNLKYIWIK